MTPQVAIIGAGAAGLAAFAGLRAAGCDALLLEARERVGGRIWTLHPPGWAAPVELGAEFVHAELDGLVLDAPPSGGVDWSRNAGKLLPADEFADGSGAVFERLAAASGPDRSFAAFLDSECNDLPARARAGALAFIEGYEAADPARISVASLRREFAASGPRAFRPHGGYDQLWAGQELGEHLWLDAPVHRIAWRPGAVTITLARQGREQSVHARAAIITLPLSVLQAGAVVFDPPLAAKQAALAGLVMGAAQRVVLRLRERFWEALHDDVGNSLAGLRFLFGGPAPGAHFPVWWAHPRAPQITGWAGGARAAALAGLSALRIRDLALADLAEALRIPAGSIASVLLESHTHDWQSDGFARGAYSYARVGGLDAHAALAAPLASTLFFAGEATDAAGRHATVPGAAASGRRAAAEALAAVSRQ